MHLDKTHRYAPRMLSRTLIKQAKRLFFDDDY